METKLDQPGIGIDAAIDGQNGTTANPAGGLPVVMRGEHGRPVCPRHLVQMTAYATGGGVTRYKCRVDGCSCTDKRDQGLNAVIPREPQMCPTCGVACEVDPMAQYTHFWRLGCPNQCGFSVNLPKFRPSRNTHVRRPRDIMDI
jgi:hypothetical protein